LSVSVPFFTPSVQVAVWQTLPWQTPDWQSWAVVQPPASGQAAQDPPQSVSVSVPFFTISVQVGS
jgi:hypothetical protein